MRCSCTLLLVFIAVRSVTEAASDWREALRSDLANVRETAVFGKSTVKPQRKIESKPASSGSVSLTPMTSPSENRLESSGTHTLPSITVTTQRIETKQPPSTLPRTLVPSVVADVTIEPFSTPEAVDEKLIERHLSPLDRFFLSRYTLGRSQRERAREAEAIYSSAQQLNEVAQSIEVSSAAGMHSDELKKLKALYYQLYLTRPK